MSKEVTSDDFQQEVLLSSVPVLVDFYSTMCGPCRRLAPVLDELEAEARGQYAIRKVNVFEQPELTNRYPVRALPTMLIFQGGTVVNKLVGYQEKRTLVRALNDAAGIVTPG